MKPQANIPPSSKIPNEQLQRYASRRETFRKLHEAGCFVMPNPWDVGTAQYLRHLGFHAIATTSSGLAFSLGFPDAEWAVTRDIVLDHIANMVAATDLPVNADFESGYADEPEAVAANVRLCVETGVAGLSIEDATGRPERPLYEVPLAVERIKAARAAIDASGADVLLTARAECFLTGHPDPLSEALRRLEAYAAAGADVLYAPGVHEPEEIQAIVAAVKPKPVNLLIAGNIGMNVSDAAALGIRRVSVGSALARAAWTGFIHAAEKIAKQGSMEGFGGLVSSSELNEFFRTDSSGRKP